MNQSELARKSSVTASYLNRVERGLFGTPSVEKLTSIATALGVKLADLTGESEPLDDDVAEGLDAAFERAAGGGQPVEIRPSGTGNGTPG